MRVLLFGGDAAPSWCHGGDPDGPPCHLCCCCVAVVLWCCGVADPDGLPRLKEWYLVPVVFRRTKNNLKLWDNFSLWRGECKDHELSDFVYIVYFIPAFCGNLWYTCHVLFLSRPVVFPVLFCILSCTWETQGSAPWSHMLGSDWLRAEQWVLHVHPTWCLVMMCQYTGAPHGSRSLASHFILVE